MDLLNSTSQSDMAVLIIAIAVCLSDGLSANGLNVLGNFIIAVGSVMLTWAAQKQSLSETSSPSASGQISLSELEKNIKDLQNRLEELEGA